MENLAVWLDGRGKEPRIGRAPIPNPGEGQILIKVSVTFHLFDPHKLLAGSSSLSMPSLIRFNDRRNRLQSSRGSGRSKPVLFQFL
jgi:hypothetical protein